MLVILSKTVTIMKRRWLGKQNLRNQKRLILVGVNKPVWTSTNRINHANQFVPRPVQLNTSRPNVSPVRPKINTGRPNFNSVRKNINTCRQNFNFGGQRFNSVKSNINTGNYVWRPKQPVSQKP